MDLQKARSLPQQPPVPPKTFISTSQQLAPNDRRKRHAQKTNERARSGLSHVRLQRNMFCEVWIAGKSTCGVRSAVANFWGGVGSTMLQLS